ncbi:circadian clock KaiB family protein [Caenimonas terrae]|uniref:Circadian clock KaiB family protein n=1 Tax=Caenimonas terrae TaxID=696074 RepID=A0ABW0NC46_9BURK
MQTFSFRLFVAGDTPNSSQALGNLAHICDSRLPGCHEIEVVDVFREPMRALAEGILMTPTLVKLSPGPVQRIVGTLSDENTLLLALGLPPDRG